MSAQERERYLRNLYQIQLEGAVGAKYVRHFTMKDVKNKTIYDLFFATNHSSGIDAMKEALWKADQTGSYALSDAIDPGQETLFTVEPNLGQLFDLLAQKFKGTEQSWPIGEEAVRNTPFRIRKTAFKN